MRYAKFGSTDMVVSEIALGTCGIGGAGWDDNSEDTRLDAIRSAVESGINFIDTAPAYNGGVAESYVGKVISSMGIRKKLYLVTKCGTEFIDVKWFTMSKNKYYNSKDEASKCCSGFVV